MVTKNCLIQISRIGGAEVLFSITACAHSRHLIGICGREETGKEGIKIKLASGQAIVKETISVKKNFQI